MRLEKGSIIFVALLLAFLLLALGIVVAILGDRENNIAIHSYDYTYSLNVAEGVLDEGRLLLEQKLDTLNKGNIYDLEKIQFLPKHKKEWTRQHLTYHFENDTSVEEQGYETWRAQPFLRNDYRIIVMAKVTMRGRHTGLLEVMSYYPILIESKQGHEIQGLRTPVRIYLKLRFTVPDNLKDGLTFYDWEEVSKPEGLK